MGKALYRKYRPISLEAVYGQDAVITPLKESIKTGNFSHAYIFTGPRGCGKTSVARIFAHEINHFPYELEDSYVDIIEIDGASNTGIDNIRDLREKAMIAPTEGRYKIYIIDEVHMLSKSAFNGLLKIIEEPPEHVIFILATTNLEKVPVTITSRAQVYNFKLADAETMFKHLRKISDAEGFSIDDDALKIIVRRGGGSFRDSISLLDQISNLKSSSDMITASDVDSALGLPEDEKIKNLLSSFEADELDTTTSILKDLLNSGRTAETIAGVIIERITEQPTPKTLHLVEKLFTVQYPFAEAKLLVAFLEAKKALATPISSTAPTPTASITSNPTSDQKRQDFLNKIAKNQAELKRRAAEAPKQPAYSETSLTDAVIQGGELNIRAFVKNVGELNNGIGIILSKSRYILSDQELKIYPSMKSYVSILRAKDNLNILKKSASGFFINVIDISETKIPEEAVFADGEPSQTPVISEKMQENLNQISDIMGTIAKTEEEDSPF